MLVRRNMDELFSLQLPPDWIAANHACVCNLDRQPWAPEDWFVPLPERGGGVRWLIVVGAGARKTAHTRC